MTSTRRRPQVARDRWGRWFRSWERQQESSNPTREARFEAMLDIVEASVPSRFRALDLGCGPGGLSLRLLRRFPGARCVGVDFDPVVLRIGRGALGDGGGRMTWLDADLRSSGWDRGLPPGKFDAAVSTTALHWLESAALRRLYRDVARRLRPGGVFVNGDHFPWGDDSFILSELAGRVRSVRAARDGSSSWGSWRAWWDAAAKDPQLGRLFPEQARRRSAHPKHGDVSLGVHLRALRAARFRSAEVVWRDLENGVLYAQR